MTEPRRWRLIDHPEIMLPGAAVLGMALVAGPIAIIEGTTSPSSKARLLCDDAVHQLLTTKDPVELQRSIFLVRWLDCSVSRRLP